MIKSTVDPGPITFTGSTLADGNFVFNASGLAVGATNVLEFSTNLVSASGWVPVLTNVAASSTASYTNAATAGKRFSVWFNLHKHWSQI